MAYKTSRNNCRASILYLKKSPAPELDPTEKSKIISELHKMIDARLFDSGPWLRYRESNHAVDKKLDQLGLQEPWGSDGLGRISTELGNELNLGLVIVFLGYWDIWDVPYKLEQYGLLDEDELNPIFEKMGRVSPDDCDFANPETSAILRPIVQRAYRDHYTLSRYSA